MKADTLRQLRRDRDITLCQIEKCEKMAECLRHVNNTQAGFMQAILLEPQEDCVERGWESFLDKRILGE